MNHQSSKRESALVFSLLRFWSLGHLVWLTLKKGEELYLVSAADSLFWFTSVLPDLAIFSKLGYFSCKIAKSKFNVSCLAQAHRKNKISIFIFSIFSIVSIFVWCFFLDRLYNCLFFEDLKDLTYWNLRNLVNLVNLLNYLTDLK